MRAFDRFVKLVTPVIMFLNAAGPVIAAIWLVILGHWQLVVVIFLIKVFVAPQVLPFALMPQVGIAATAMYFAKKQNRIFTYLIVGLAHLYAAALMSVWAIGTLALFASASGTSQATSTLTPYLLWAYGIATAPWTYLIMRDVSETVSPAQVLCFFQQIGCVAAMLVMLLAGASLMVGGGLIATTTLLSLVLIVPTAGYEMLRSGAFQVLEEKVGHKLPRF
jgi:hypothetical protein